MNNDTNDRNNENKISGTHGEHLFRHLPGNITATFPPPPGLAQDCVARSVASARPEGLQLEVRLRHGGAAVVVDISLPPYYPEHSPIVELREEAGDADAGADASRAALLRQFEAFCGV